MRSLKDWFLCWEVTARLWKISPALAPCSVRLPHESWRALTGSASIVCGWFFHSSTGAPPAGQDAVLIADRSSAPPLDCACIVGCQPAEFHFDAARHTFLLEDLIHVYDLVGALEAVIGDQRNDHVFRRSGEHLADQFIAVFDHRVGFAREWAVVMGFGVVVYQMEQNQIRLFMFEQIHRRQCARGAKPTLRLLWRNSASC